MLIFIDIILFIQRKTASINSSKNLPKIQRSDQKLWLLRTGTLVWSDDTSASPSSDSISTPRKTPSGNSSKNLSLIQRSIQKLWPFRTGTLVSRRPPQRVAIPHLLQGKQRPETLLKIWARSNGQIKKFWLLRTRILVWSDETSVSTSSDSTSTPRKTMSGNSSKNLSKIPLSDQKLCPFQTRTLVWSAEHSASPSSNSPSTPRKTASGNSSKNLSEIQRSDQKLWPFWIGSLVWSDETSASPCSDSTSTPRKIASENSSKNLSEIQRSD